MTEDNTEESQEMGIAPRLKWAPILAMALLAIELLVLLALVLFLKARPEPAIGPLSMEMYDEKPDWLICGGESGQNHRFMKPIWAHRIMEECEAAGIAFFMKQMSGARPTSAGIPPDLMLRQFPIGISLHR